MKLKETLKSTKVKIIILIVVIVASVLAFWFGLRTVLKTDYPLLAVTSVSMEPTLQFGDLIVVQGGLDGGEIKAALAPEGDILVFYNPNDPNNLVVQRTIEKYSNEDTWFFKTMGDKEGVSDKYDISEQYVVGKVVWRVPLLGYVILFMQWILGTSTGMLVVIILAFIFILYIRRPSLKRKARGA